MSSAEVVLDHELGIEEQDWHTRAVFAGSAAVVVEVHVDIS